MKKLRAIFLLLLVGLMGLSTDLLGRRHSRRHRSHRSSTRHDYTPIYKNVNLCCVGYVYGKREVTGYLEEEEGGCDGIIIETDDYPEVSRGQEITRRIEVNANNVFVTQHQGSPFLVRGIDFFGGCPDYPLKRDFYGKKRKAGYVYKRRGWPSEKRWNYDGPDENMALCKGLPVTRDLEVTKIHRRNFCGRRVILCEELQNLRHPEWTKLKVRIETDDYPDACPGMILRGVWITHPNVFVVNEWNHIERADDFFALMEK